MTRLRFDGLWSMTLAIRIRRHWERQGYALAVEPPRLTRPARDIDVIGFALVDGRWQLTGSRS